MSPTVLFWPAFAQVTLTVVVLVAMGRARSASMRARSQTIQDVAMNRPSDWDEAATKASNNFKNHFELPVLFFVAVSMAMALRVVDPLLVGAAWVFVAARVVQSAVHLGSNTVSVRASAYFVGVVALLALWIDLAIRVASA